MSWKCENKVLCCIILYYHSIHYLFDTLIVCLISAVISKFQHSVIYCALAILEATVLIIKKETNK